MWGLSALSGATVLPSHPLQPTYFSFALFSPASRPNCLWLLISKIHPQHRGLLGSGGQLGGRVVHTGRWLIIRDYPKYPRTASLGTRIPRILLPVASMVKTRAQFVPPSSINWLISLSICSETCESFFFHNNPEFTIEHHQFFRVASLAGLHLLNFLLNQQISYSNFSDVWKYYSQSCIYNQNMKTYNNWNFGQRLHNSRRRFYRRQLWLFLFGRTAPRIICIIWQVQESTNYDRVPELDVKAIFWRLLSALCSCSLFTFFAKPIIICEIWQFHDSTDQESLNLMDFGVVLINHENVF